MPTPLDDAIASAHDGVPDCLAVGLIDMTTGLLLGSKTVEPCSPELVDLVAAATGELFQGPNVTAIEMLFRKERRLAEDGAHYFSEVIITSPPVVHVFQRCKHNPDVVLITIARGSANLGLVLTKARMSLAAVEAAC